MFHIFQLFMAFVMSFQLASCGTPFGDTASLVRDDTLTFTPTDRNGCLISKQKIKPLNGMGNGPLYGWKQHRFTMDASKYFEELNIPIIRFHDVEYLNSQNQAVNVSAIFPDSQADESEGRSYNFTATDQLLKAAVETGARVIFRLGENILNLGSATGSNAPPSDFGKWARIAERIVAHYEDGWNNGFHYKGIMWEVWNEPDVSKCWNGTFDAYCEFYKTVWQCIRAKHPDADVSPSYAYRAENRQKLYRCIKDNHLGISHCFVHHYWEDFSGIEDDARQLSQELEQYGLKTDIILNEWNYLSSDGGWNNLASTFYAIQTQQAAAWYAKQLVHMQAAKDLAGAVYYISDMPGFWTGLYKLDHTGKAVPLPSCKTFYYFGKLYRLGNEIEPNAVPKDVYALAASDGKAIGILIANFSAQEKRLQVRLNAIRLQNRDIFINESPYEANGGSIPVTMSPYEVTYISIGAPK